MHYQRYKDNKPERSRGASIGIGAAIAHRLAQEGANLILFSRTESKLKYLSEEIQSKIDTNTIKIFTTAVDVASHVQVTKAVSNVVKQNGPIDVLINNTGLALRAPATFPDLKIEDVVAMTETNVNGYLFATYAVLNEGGMRERGQRTILNVTSTTAMEAPPFPSESIYYGSKRFQEGFTDALRTELAGTNIKVLALRPGVVATHFHKQRVDFDKDAYDSFMEGFETLLAEDVAEAAAWMLVRKNESW
ncbi:NAD(P)-binding protein [Paraphaeosphaeria sporulosa]|uniref:NAD(P)-binding protein n=1 Tax=Paraphaeosphaeria sporulosa TaxID=1460663 RepID=A0A177CJP8_9PLEO|nr:NAD(P)-binding protein [Paraphaeosphaeria sporulosa]OAG07723.1 NAD(P)-binding protein [Paraphaeosphaeria sporulosa]